MNKKNPTFFFFAIFFSCVLFFSFDINAESNLGKDIFVGRRCITCHVIGRGTFVGPDLYNIFDKYSNEEILSWITNPQSIYEKYSKMPINKEYPPMPNLGIDLSEATELLNYIRNTRNIVERNSKVLIQGRINNFTTDKFLQNEPIELEAVMADKILSTKKVIIKDGYFKFKNLPGNSAYRIKLIYDGIEYSTDKFYFLPEENKKKVDLTVFETTQNQSSIKTSSVHLIITYDEDSKSIIVAEIINIDNLSRNIFVGTNDISEKIRHVGSYSLFPKIINLGFPHRNKDTFIVSDNIITDTLPMPPGNRRVVFTYVVKLNLLSTTLSKIFLNDIPNLAIIVPENILSFDIEGLEYTKKETQIKELTDEKYTTYSIKNIRKGDALNLKFKKYDIFLNTKSVVGIIFLIFVLAALGFTIFKKGVKK